MSEYSASDRLSIDSRYGEYRDSRDSTSIAYADAAMPPPRPPRANATGPSKQSNGRLQTILSPISPGSETDISPSGAAAIAAFQSVMAKRRGVTEEDLAQAEYEKEKEREMAIQMDRQRRIRDKVPGRKATKPRAGDIDGELLNTSQYP